MASNYTVKIGFKILVGVLFVFSCRLGVPTDSQVATFTPTPALIAEANAASPTVLVSPTPTASPTSAASPTVQLSPAPATSPTAQLSPTPTEQPFVLPGGRILFAPFPRSPAYVEAWCTASFHFSWLHLPDMTVEPHPYLTFVYPVVDVGVTLSPDLAQLAFARESHNEAAEFTCGEWTVAMQHGRVDGSEAIQVGPSFSGDHVLDNRAAGNGISWAANGRVFAFALTHDWQSVDSEQALYLYDLASGQFQTLTVDALQPSAFALSPDGTQVAFTDLSATPGLSVINSDGSNQRMIVEGWVGRNLVWHPDGQHIFFVLDQPEIGIYSVDIATGTITPIATTDDPAYLGLSPDGSLLAYEDNGLYVVSSEGGEPLRLLRAASQWVWSPDSQYLAYTSGDGIFIIDRLGNGLVEVYRDEQMFPGALIGWLP
jgi:hypothetical protein